MEAQIEAKELEDLFQSLTRKELKLIAQHFDVSLKDIANADMIDLLFGITYVLKRRENPSITVDEIDDLPMAEVLAFLGVGTLTPEATTS